MKRGAIRHLLLLGLFLSSSGMGWSLTLSDIRSAIRRNVRDTGTTLRRYSDATILTYINEAQRVVINETWAESTTTTTVLVSGTARYTLPTNAIQPWRVTLSGQALSQYSFRQLDNDNFQGTWSTASGTPGYFIWDAANSSSILLYPIPSASGASLVISYYRIPTDLASDSDVPFDGDNRLYTYHDILIYYSSDRILISENRSSEAQAYENLFVQGLQRMSEAVGQKAPRPILPAKENRP